MARSQEVHYYTSIELGTSTLKVISACEIARNKELEIIGFGETPSLCIRKGEVNNISMVEEKLREVIDTVSRQSGIDISQHFIILCLSGAYISQRAFSTTINITSPNRTITQEDINLVIKNARKLEIDKNRYALSTTTRKFVLSGGRETLAPLGMTTDELTVEILVHLAHLDKMRSAYNCVKNVLGRDINDICYAPQALASACIRSVDVAQSGQLLVDLGAGVSSYVVITTAGCYAAGQLAVGLEHVANDLAIAFDVPYHVALQLLNDFGSEKLQCSISPRRAHQANQVTVTPGLGAQKRSISTTDIETIVQVRVQELLEIIRARLDKEKALNHIGKTVMLSGGLSLLPGVHELASEVFGCPAVAARPHSLSGEAAIVGNARYVVPLGGLHYAQQNYAIYRSQQQEAEIASSKENRLLSWCKRIFNF